MARLRSVVKHSYIKAFRNGLGRARAHVNYIKFRPGKDKDEVGSRAFFSDKEDGLTSQHVNYALDRQTGRGVLVHKLIVSPGVQDANTQEYVREMMHDLGRQKGLELEWYAVEHRNTANPHAHVVIMGTDKNGRQVSLSKGDYTKLKECGDRYLDRNKLLEKQKEREKAKEEEKKRPLGRKLKEALKAAKKEFDRVMRSDDQERKRSRLEALKAQEAESLGDAPDYDQAAEKRVAKEERKKLAQEEAWKYYSKPLEVKMAHETVKYTWVMPIGELRELEKRHSQEVELGRSLLPAEDLERLQIWIKDAYFEEKVLSRKATEVEKIELTPTDRADIKVSKGSVLEELKEVRQLHSSGKVALTTVEDKALANWIAEKEAVEPIKVTVDGVEEPVVYDKQDSKESLEFLANEYRKGEDWAKDGITKAEYKKLRDWIKEKRQHEEKERQAELQKVHQKVHQKDRELEKPSKEESKGKGEQ